jgi:4-hydroxybenzoate polyprenyltransferase
VFTLSPYIRLMRLHQPTGIWLLLIPCLWGMSFADLTRVVDMYMVLLFTVGAVVMRGAGCVVNDIIDRDLDDKVERTKKRPIASGELSVKQACVLLGVLLLAGLMVLLQLSKLSIIIGFMSAILVVVYPFMKRVFHFPQLVLGITFNMGALISWAAMQEEISQQSLLLYLSCLCWTLGYDTIYAHQDRRDDIKAGIKSTAVLLGDFTKPFVALFYAITWGLLVYVGFLQGYGFGFYLMMLPAALHLGWQVYKVNLANPRSCMSVFKSNTVFGIIVLAAILLQKSLILP